LRGPQTPGELRGNASRLHEFTGLEEIEQTLNGLMTRDEPLVVRLPRQPGQKEVRFVHLLAGDIDLESLASEVEHIAATPKRSSHEQVERLDQKVDALAAEVESLKLQFEQFKKQFE
jgi:uncharacterized protein YceH (UPF0502 family)